MIREYVTKGVKSAFRALGYDISRWQPQRVQASRLLTVINEVQADIVIDVGANVGQFAAELLSAGFARRIISFEPLEAEHQQLSIRANGIRNWTVAPRCALGSSAGRVTIHRAANSVSSSLLQMTSAHLNAAPTSQNVDEETVDLCRLDQCQELAIDSHAKLFLKADTQGYELQVLSGATALMPRIRGMILETSLVPLYEDSPLLTDVVMTAQQLGFVPHDIFLGICSPRGQVLQADIVFTRNGAVSCS